MVTKIKNMWLGGKNVRFKRTESIYFSYFSALFGEKIKEYVGGGIIWIKKSSENIFPFNPLPCLKKN